MSYMVRFVTALLLAALLAGCRAQPTPAGAATAPNATSQEAGVTIVTTFYPMYIMALNVAGNVPGVAVVPMTQPTAGCLHDYALTTADRKNLDTADILIINGAGMESFLDKVIEQKPQMPIVEASQGISLIEGGEASPNAHVWVSITDAMTQVRTIAEGLAQHDPAHADAYRANAAGYIAKLQALRDRMHASLDGLPRRDIVTFHEAFPYFAREFDLNIAGVVEHEPGTEPSAKELSDTIELVRELNIQALFTEPQYPAKAAETIARETGSRVYQLDPAVTGDMDADAYLRAMEANMVVLQEALK